MSTVNKNTMTKTVFTAGIDKKAENRVKSEDGAI